jgi:membrane-bound lytic murein transglycosylase D
MAALVLGALVTGCGATVKSQPPAVTPAPAVAPVPVQAPAPPPPDPVTVLIATSQAHFADGERELRAGHLEKAKAAFNQAIEVLLESPTGARSEPRIREHFDKLVDRISTYEISALAAGDGFTEKKYEPASIDDLLNVATFTLPPTPAVETAVKSDASEHDIPIPFNSRVLSYIELLQGRLHDFIEDGLQRGSKYLPMIQSVFRAEGLPLDLAYVPLIESAFKPNALSRAKAKGVWQFMRGTALENGLKHDWYIDERSDPEKATLAAAKYLKTLSKIFDGDWHLALASYNGGPARVQRAMKRSGVDDFWALVDKPKVLPRETREYVPMILAAMVIARNPAQYGFSLIADDEPAIAIERVTLPRPVDLRRVAEWTGTSIDVIQGLNPELRRWTTPVSAAKYDLKVPAGTADVLKAQLDHAAPGDTAALKWHTVKRGETLLTIARKLGVNRADLAEANYLSAKARVTVGQKLVIPREPSALLTARADRPAPVAESRRPAVEQVVAKAPDASSVDQAKLIYRVKKGDTLFSIARLYNTTVASLKTWNKIAGSTIAPGDRLTIFASRTQ